jgi:ubiquinone/menaquinone biosynthesis C-methylase UbiE
VSADLPADPHRTDYDRAAADYDRRWRRYNERSLALLRPWIDRRRLGRVLDVGCGTANLVPRLAAWAASVERYVGLDPSFEMLRMAGAKAAAVPFPAALLSAPAEALPLRAASFDTAVSASSLHYWPDPLAGLREIRRVLRPGGALLLLDWDRGPLPMRLLDAWMRTTGVRYRRMYTAREVEGMLGEAGFEVVGRTAGGAGGVWRLAGFRALVD